MSGVARNTQPTMTLLLVAAVAVMTIGCRKSPETVGEPLRREASALPQEITTSFGAEMVLIPGGEFRMGSDAAVDAQPVHHVSVDRFYMDRHEVTQSLYERVMGANPSRRKGETNPVERVRWFDAVKFCNARSVREGLEPCYDLKTKTCRFEANGYRLPTEAEWEYACRAGTTGDYYFGNDSREMGASVWSKENSRRRHHPVGRKRPNEFGLHDMAGNVREWCNDWYESSYYGGTPGENPRGPARGGKKVLRGGAFSCTAESCSSWTRYCDEPGFTDACVAAADYGFRCVLRRAEPATKEETPTSADGECLLQSDTIKALANHVQPSDDSTEPNKPMTTGFLFGEVYLRHKTGSGHPERPERLTAIVAMLKKKGLLDRLTAITPKPADDRWITSVHTPEYVQRVKTNCARGIGYVDSPDAPASKESYNVAVEAVGGVLLTIDRVMERKVNNAFCAVRPPGHHALQEKAMGFCLFNNVAIAARYIQQKHKLAKVLIIDWDVHHGNGTQAIFYDDPTVFYFSVHQFPFYPGTGSAAENGTGRGLNCTLNIPLPAGTGDRKYREVFEQVLKPAAIAFEPDFVLISAGFDAHEDDLLGGMKVTTEGFAELTRIVKGIAEQCCAGRLVSILEGGYDLDGLAESAAAHFRALMDESGHGDTEE